MFCCCYINDAFLKKNVHYDTFINFMSTWSSKKLLIHKNSFLESDFAFLFVFQKNKSERESSALSSAKVNGSRSSSWAIAVF
jgi:hypothetical protein